MKRSVARYFSPLLGIVLFGLAVWALQHALREYRYRDIIRCVRNLPSRSVMLCLLLTIGNYWVLTAYELLAFRYIRHPMRYRKIALASFIGYAFSNSIGLSMLSGGSVRYRLYSNWGLSAPEIVQVIIFTTFTFWLGLLAVTGMLLLIEPLGVREILHLPLFCARPLGVSCLGVVGLYLSWSAFQRRPIRALNWEFRLPSLRLSVGQIALASFELILAGTTLYMLLPASAMRSYPGFLSAYFLAMITGAASQVPGGLGIFEGILVFLFASTVSASALLGSLVVYRGIYYLLPLVVAVSLLGFYELRQRRAVVTRVGRFIGSWVPALAPNILACSTFIAGAMLLFSGATPTAGERLAWMIRMFPLPVTELSHFLASLIGTGFLLLAWGLQRRLDAAYVSTRTLLGVGIVVALLKGLNYEEAIVLTILLTALWPARQHFYRQASLISERFSAAWAAAIIIVLFCSVALGLFSFKHVEYSHELWWRFVFSDDAPRFLRATVGSIGATLLFALVRLLRPVPPSTGTAMTEDFSRAATIIRSSRRTSSNLALLGDKTFFFNDPRSAFIMYGVSGRSWVALGDPVGPEDEMPELIWRFRKLCDRYDGWTVFYDVGRTHIYLYLDVGLTLLKIGEEARVPLASFSLEGSSQKDLRYSHHRVEKDGCTFEVVEARQVSELLPALHDISSAWLSTKRVKEKRFSMSRFNERYLKRFPIALVRQGGRLVAFANLWLGAEHEEFSVDLMRYLPAGSREVMDYLFIELMLWGKARGYRWFNLGAAPLSGLRNRALAPTWNRLGAFLFRHGEHFYNFQGLRQYKAKFHPEWQPKYLASPGGLALPRILSDAASLIAGGLKGLMKTRDSSQEVYRSGENAIH